MKTINVEIHDHTARKLVEFFGQMLVKTQAYITHDRANIPAETMIEFEERMRDCDAMLDQLKDQT